MINLFVFTGLFYFGINTIMKIICEFDKIDKIDQCVVYMMETILIQNTITKDQENLRNEMWKKYLKLNNTR